MAGKKRTGNNRRKHGNFCSDCAGECLSPGLRRMYFARRRKRTPGTLYVARGLRASFHSPQVSETSFHTPAKPGGHFYPGELFGRREKQVSTEP